MNTVWPQPGFNFTGGVWQGLGIVRALVYENTSNIRIFRLISSSYFHVCGFVIFIWNVCDIFALVSQIRYRQLTTSISLYLVRFSTYFLLQHRLLIMFINNSNVHKTLTCLKDVDCFDATWFWRCGLLNPFFLFMSHHLTHDVAAVV